MKRASCQCGQLSAECDGEPVRVSVCHCFDCQRRSGSAFAAQVRFPRSAVRITGEAREWTRLSSDGGGAVFSFYPRCGSTVYYANLPDHDLIAIPIGAFAGLEFPLPAYSVYERRKHAWVDITGDGVEHFA